MKIEIWSDYVCPFCYIGKRRLEEALEQTGLGEKAEVVFKAYELDPNSPAVSDTLMTEVLAKKYGMSVEEAKKMTDNVVDQAKSVGLNYNFDVMTPANTFNAHRLAKLAEQEGFDKTVSESLLKAYFIDGEKIGAEDVLLRIAEEAGISRDRAKAVLDSDEFADDVRMDIAEAQQIGVKGVPFFVIDRKYAISGAQPAEAFANALRQAAEEEV
ncbi:MULTISPECIES: DsbA family protein [Sporosarcina]|uniref:DsbA family dithiol-disulfide isomerase n=1 Tax=Sporosarcina psychrophila TaxID=1476 RepID=A0ABV2K818_SPOPS|nr:MULTISPECIES: DsbA family oxidoreductase [Sporosarcina]AMQ04904.1 disulfide bond formation protein DsbA [Sporosarcina psychrophila]QNK88627.1 DsbA family oxidoreductase [Sporosarcina sp. resist]